MRHISRPGKRRNHDSRNTESVPGEVSIGIVWWRAVRKFRVRTTWIGGAGADIYRLDAVRTRHIRWRWPMIVEPTCFVEGEDENLVFPSGAVHYFIDQSSGVFHASLNIGTQPGMLIVVCSLDISNRRQCAAGNICIELRELEDVRASTIGAEPAHETCECGGRRV